jgi:hypothetical protein
MQRREFLAAVSAAASIVPAINASASNLSQPVAGIEVPQTALALAATGLASSAEIPEVYAHSLRTFLFAELIARAKRIDHDTEVVYCAAILHDIGLSPAHMTQKQLFQVDSANAARDLLREHHVSPAKLDLVWDAVALHDQGGIASWKAPEVALVNAGVAADFGANLELLAHDDVVSVLLAAPRDGFIDAFLGVVAAFVRRKPHATGSCWVADVGYKMVPGFHVSNFADDVKADPFAGYERPRATLR